MTLLDSPILETHAQSAVGVCLWTWLLKNYQRLEVRSTTSVETKRVQCSRLAFASGSRLPGSLSTTTSLFQQIIPIVGNSFCKFYIEEHQLYHRRESFSVGLSGVQCTQHSGKKTMRLHNYPKPGHNGLHQFNWVSSVKHVWSQFEKKKSANYISQQYEYISTL